MKKETAKIEEKFCCISCATTVEKEVNKLDGVKSAYVDYAENSITVEFDENVIKMETINNEVKEVLARFEI